MRARPASASLALALCAIGAGVLALVLTWSGWRLPIAMLAGVVMGFSIYLVVLLLARRS